MFSLLTISSLISVIALTQARQSSLLAVPALSEDNNSPGFPVFMNERHEWSCGKARISVPFTVDDINNDRQLKGATSTGAEVFFGKLVDEPNSIVSLKDDEIPEDGNESYVTIDDQDILIGGWDTTLQDGHKVLTHNFVALPYLCWDRESGKSAQVLFTSGQFANDNCGKVMPVTLRLVDQN